MTREILYIFIGVWSGMAVLIPLVVLFIGCWEGQRGDMRVILGPFEERMRQIKQSTRVQTVKRKKTKLRKDNKKKRRDEDDVSFHSTISLDTNVSGSANCCHICLEDFKPGDHVSSSKSKSCRHMFHKDCINAWLITHNDCPVCRNEFLTTVNEDEIGQEASAEEAESMA